MITHSPTTFSIIIPAYKAQYLQESIDSVISQSYPNWQLVIFNDGSPYDLDTIINKYNDKRILYKKREKGYGSRNLVKNWNECLHYATGDYVINMGDDDFLLPNCLQEYTELITKYPLVNVFHGWTKIINEVSEPLAITQQHPEHESAGAFILRSWKGDDFYMGDVAIKRSWLLDNGGYVDFPYAWNSDHVTAYQAAYEHGVVSTSHIVFAYRKHTATISNTSNNLLGKLQADIKAKQWFERFILTLSSKDIDGIIRKMLLEEMLPLWYEKRVALDFAECNRRAPWKIMTAWGLINKYSINIKTLLRAIAYSITI